MAYRAGPPVSFYRVKNPPECEMPHEKQMQTIAAVAVTAACTALAFFCLIRRRRPQRIPPAWVTDLLSDADRKLSLDEWENGAVWRQDNGWVGTDYAHGEEAAVHIAGYALSTTPAGFSKLTGAVHFGPGAESHKGLCHGGSMCTVMDDVIGWVGFCVSGQCKPWSGFTVQVNTTLQAPITVGSWLKVDAEIYEVERRKVKIRAALTAPATAGTVEVVHCTGEGLFVLKKEAV
jgi:acyl-coenzyme A thioesterase PaaI-like protein